MGLEQDARAASEGAHRDLEDQVGAVGASDDQPVQRAVATFARSARTVARLREQMLAGERRDHILRAELANAMTDIADLRWQLNSRAAANGSKRLTRYTQDEAEDLYGTSDILAPPPTIGER